MLTLLLTAHIAHYSDASSLLTAQYTSEKHRMSDTLAKAHQFQHHGEMLHQEADQHAAISRKEEQASADAQKKAMKAKMKAARSKTEAEEENSKAQNAQLAGQALAAAAAADFTHAAVLEGKAQSEEAAAASEEGEVASDEADEEADEAAVAASEWIPFFDVVADVTGGAVAVALSADIVKSQALATKNEVASMKDSVKAGREKAKAMELREKKLVKQKYMKELRSMAQLKFVAAMGEAEFADKLIEDSKMEEKWATQNKGRSQEESAAAKEFGMKSMHAIQNASVESKRAEELRSRAAQFGAKATELLPVAFLSAALLLLSSWTVGFSVDDLTKVSGELQQGFLMARMPRDPRKSGKWKWPMFVLEWLVFAMSGLLAASLFCNKVPLEATKKDDLDSAVSVWYAFFWALISVLSVVLVRGACFSIWALADLEAARVCAQNCLTWGDMKKLLLETAIAECLVALNASVAYGVLGLFGYVTLRDSFHRISHVNPLMFPYVTAMIFIVALRACCGLLRCPCSCNVPAIAREVGFLTRMWQNASWWCNAVAPAIILYMCYIKFHPIWESFQDVAQSLPIVFRGGPALLLAFVLDLAIYIRLLCLEPQKELFSKVTATSSWADGRFWRSHH